jgi:hypothetical protein
MQGNNNLYTCSEQVHKGQEEERKKINEAINRGGRAAQGIFLRPLGGWDRAFEFCLGHGCSSLVFAAC